MSAAPQRSWESMAAEHSVPWAASRRDVSVEIDGRDNYHLWEVVDAAGQHVALIVEPAAVDSSDGVPVILALARAHHEGCQRQRDALSIDRTAPLVLVNVPGAVSTVIGARHVAEFHGDTTGGRDAATARRDARLVRAMLEDALERVDGQPGAPVAASADPLSESTRLAALHLDAELMGDRLPSATASAIRTVLRALER